MGTLITDPNAPPDPNAVAPIPDHQMTEGWIGRAHNPVTPGAPPSADNPTGTPPTEIDPDAPLIDGGPPPAVPVADEPPSTTTTRAPVAKKDEEKEDDHDRSAKKAHKK